MMRDHGTEARERAHSFLSRHRYSGGECGEASGGAVAKVAKRIVTKALRQHETAEHGGKHEKLRLKSGGEVRGEESKGRPDRKGGHGKIGAVNIAIGNPEKEKMAEQMGLQKGIQIGAQAAAAKAGGAGGPPMMAPHPPMGGPPGGMPPGAGPPPGAMPPGAGAPPGGMPPRPPGVMASGGEVKVRGHTRRRAGGAV